MKIEIRQDTGYFIWELPAIMDKMITDVPDASLRKEVDAVIRRHLMVATEQFTMLAVRSALKLVGGDGNYLAELESALRDVGLRFNRPL